MIVLGMVIDALLIAGGVALGSYIQMKFNFPW